MVRSIKTWFERLGLQRRIMLYVSAGLVVFSAIFGFVAVQAIQQSTDLVFHERLLAARTIARAVDGDLAHIESELGATSNSLTTPLTTNHLVDAQDSLHSLYNHWVSFYGFTSPCTLLLTDPRGRVLLSEPTDSGLVGHDLSQIPSLKEAILSPHAVIAEGTALDGTGRPTVVFETPVHAKSGTIGFLVGEINRDHLGAELKSWLSMSESDYHVELIDDHGMVVARSEAGATSVLSVHWPLVASYLQTDQPTVQIHHVEDDNQDLSHVIAFVPLTQMPWGVVVEEPVDEALLLPRQLQNQLFGFGVLGLIGGLVLAWVTTRTIVRSINALTRASQEIASGNLDRPLDVSGADEVGILARSFDNMRVEVKQSREEIARWNRELEGRVEQRTRELAALVESSHALTSTLDLDALFEIVMKETRQVLPSAEGIALFLYEPETETLVLRSSFGFDASEMAQWRFRRGEGIGGQVFETQQPVLLKIATAVQSAQANFSDENRAHWLRAVQGRELQGALGVPLVSKGARLGVQVVYNFSRPAAFSESDVPVLQALVNQAAAAIENARLYKEASEVGALRELNRLKSEFVTRASHELRTPMTAIKSLAETLLRRDLQLDAETQQEFLSGIDSAADRLAHIVEQLLTLSRVEAGRFQVRREPVDVEQVLARVVSQFHAQNPTRDLKVNIAGRVPLARGDTERVEDVLTNLVSNALKYSPPNTTVRLQARAPNGTIDISVADDGIGIPRELQEKIFERFYRVDNSLTRHVGGAGLGLFMCKTYVEAMGGKIGVESVLGQGATFTFSLPIADDTQDASNRN
jgi:signal transduction histidine kinase